MGGGKRGYLDGQMLIAMPTMGDERFARSVIYVCAHSTEGAMGIVVNQPASHISFSDLLVQLEVIPAADLIQLPPRVGGSLSAEASSSEGAYAPIPVPHAWRRKPARIPKLLPRCRLSHRLFLSHGPDAAARGPALVLRH